MQLINKIMINSRIAIIIGTKAELIKCMPIMVELQKQKKDYWFIHTGQHPLGEACEEFGIKKPDFILSKEPKLSTKFWSKINGSSVVWCFKMIPKVRKIIRKIQPKYVIYHGDTMSASIAAIGSSKFMHNKKNWKNVHLEAGLRSGSLFEPFPEEISRQICDKFSDILLAVSNRTKNNLRKFEKKKNVVLAGNTIVDSSWISYQKSKSKKIKVPKEFVLINIHRHENIRDAKRLKKVVDIIKGIKIKAIWPLHDNTELYLNEYGLMAGLKAMKNIKIMPLTDYFTFIYFMSQCKYLVTDGGSIQEESLVFKKPCILLREKTERQEGLSTGLNFLTKLNVKKTRELIRKLENNEIKFEKFENPYGKKGLSKKIVNMLK
jgi:UDP-N-acetylglucosamine 2-epimerase (non-hydrolysing)